MARGQTYNHERISRTDPVTGRPMVQLTSFPTTSQHMPYSCRGVTNGFTPDSATIVFRSMRSNERDAPWDLFRVDVDGANLAQLTDGDHVGGVVVSSPDGTEWVLTVDDAGVVSATEV